MSTGDPRVASTETEFTPLMSEGKEEDLDVDQDEEEPRNEGRGPRDVEAGSAGSVSHMVMLEEDLVSTVHLISVPLLILSVATVGFILWWLQDILVPFTVAVFFVYLLAPLVNLLTKPLGACCGCWLNGTAAGASVSVNGPARAMAVADSASVEASGVSSDSGVTEVMDQLRTARCPRWLAVALSLVITFVAVGLLFFLVADAVHEFETENLGAYEAQAKKLINKLGLWLRDTLHVDGSALLGQMKQELRVAETIRSLATALFTLVANTAFILLVVVFLMLEHVSHERSTLRGKIDDQIQRYIGLKTLISASVGLLAYMVLGPLLGVKMAHLFGVLTFLLNYIPNIGPIIATALPLPVVLLDPALSGFEMLLAFALPTTIHLVVGNVVEPKLFGSRLDLHPVVVLLALAFWYSLWGAVGAILSVPMTAAIRIVLSHMTHPYARVVLSLLEGRIGVERRRRRAVL